MQQALTEHNPTPGVVAAAEGDVSLTSLLSTFQQQHLYYMASKARA